ncbi:MAG: Asp/Glu racemase [Pyrinomonadaceae bacterium]|nr:Asp/Glu racemase [Pyrinomonadaceae bacterium]
MSKRKITFIHTSPAALNPVKNFYAEAAPELEATNLLDDGLLRLLAAMNYDVVEDRLSEMVKAARDSYEADLIMITCSSVTQAMVEKLSGACSVPILKIDEPMAREAVKAGGRVGVAVTFEPTIEPTSKLLRDTAARSRAEIEIVTEVMPDAYDALLAGDFHTHDALLLEGIGRLVDQNVNAIVLAQVSMARIMKQLNGKFQVPVLTSLHTSLSAVREMLGADV